MEVVFTKSCWKYFVPENSVRAGEWNGQEHGDKASLTISSSGSPPFSLTIVEEANGSKVTVELRENVVYKCVDSQRCFVVLVPSEKQDADEAFTRVGLGFNTREDSSAFVDEVLKSSGVDSLVAYSPDVVAERSSSPGVVRPESHKDSDFGSMPDIQFDGNSAEDTAVTVGAENSSIRGAVPDLHMDADTVDAPHAAVSPRPSMHPKKHSVLDGEKDGGKSGDGVKKADGGSDSENADAVKDDKGDDDSEEGKNVLERKHLDEDITMDVWRKHKKHVFVVSIAGKPIYSRYGDEQNLAPFMASLSAMASFIEDSHDVLHYFVAGEHQVIFLLRGPLILVSVCSTRETRADIVRELDYVHSQIVSVLTNSSIDKIFEQRPDFDIRGLLAGTDRLLDNLMHHMNFEPGFMFHALRPLMMPIADRKNIANALQHAACPQLLFALLIHGFNFIDMARPKKFSLDAKDVHLLMNFVNSSSSFRMSTTWTPICLPTFDSRGFLHALISFLPNGACLILLSAHLDAFYKLNSCANDIKDHLAHTGGIDAITRAVAATNNISLSDIDPSPSLFHFVYRSHQLRQVVLSGFVPPYDTVHEHKRLLRVYQRVRDAALTGSTPHANVLQVSARAASTALDSSASGELAHKVYFQVSEHEAVLAYISKGVELFAAFSTFETKASCIYLANKILSWVSERAQDLFVLDMPTW